MSKKKKNIILENIKLITAGAKGVAVGKTEEGKTVLISGAVPGDVVNARVKKSKSKYFEAEAVEILPSLSMMMKLGILNPYTANFLATSDFIPPVA